MFWIAVGALSAILIEVFLVPTSGHPLFLHIVAGLIVLGGIVRGGI